MASEDITLAEALNLTSKYLPSWKKLSTNDVIISYVCGGFANRLYKLRNFSSVNTEPKEVLIRIYGKKVFDDCGGKIITEPEEALLFHELSNRKLGPKLFGVFEGGMVTEFIPNHTITNDDLGKSTIRKEIARNLAKYHALDIPINKTPMNAFPKIEHYLKQFETDAKEKLRTREAREVLSEESLDMLLNTDYKSEIEWLRDQESQMVSPLVFSIMDNHRLNCLIRDEPNDKGERVMLIDYECSQMASRGFDLGHEFTNYVVDSKESNWLSGLDYPNEDIRREYVKEYLKEAKLQGLVKERDDVIDSVDHVIMEAEFYGMMLNLMFGLMMAAILTGFIEKKHSAVHYPVITLKLYKERKAAFISKYGEMF